MATYLSDIVGTGTGDDPFRPAIADVGGVGFTWTCLCDGRADATQAPGKMLVRCAELPAFAGDKRIVPVTRALLAENGAPDDGETDEDALALKIVRRFLLRQWLKNNDLPRLDLTMADIPPAKRQAVAAFLTGKGIDLSGITGSSTIADALRTILPQIKARIHPVPMRRGGTFTDNFTDTNGTALESHTPSGGTAWTRVDGSASAAIISSNQLVLNVPGSNTAYQCDDQGSADQYVQYTVKTNYLNSYICNRISDAANWIGVRWGGGFIVKDIAGAETVIAWGTNGSTGNTARLESDGDAHQTYLNGSPNAGPVNEAHNNTVTRQGIRVTASGTGTLLDDFEAGVLGAIGVGARSYGFLLA